MNLFENERKTRIYNISREITNIFKNFLGVEETKEALIGHLKPEDDVWFTTAEAIAAIQKNNEAEFEQSSPFGVVVLKKSYNGGIVMAQKESRFELVDFRFASSERKSWKKTK